MTTMRRWRRITLAAGLAAVVLLGAGLRDARAVSDIHADWQPWAHLTGVYDVFESVPSGGLVAAAHDGLWTIDVHANLSKLARGPSGFALNNNTESYIAVVPRLHVSSGCDFNPGDTFILVTSWPQGLIRVDSSGHASRFVTFNNVDGVGGITVDTTGSFDHRLLVTAAKKDKTVLFAVDCAARVTTITTIGPPVEGGMEVAPRTFGAFAGDLIAPDGVTDRIWAFAPDGSTRLVGQTGFATGTDAGICCVGFLPSGFIEDGGAAYISDRRTPDNVFAGTDTVWRYTSDALALDGVGDGDLLVATEGEGYTARVHCASTCSVLVLGEAANNSHPEGHIAFIRGRAAAATSASTTLVAGRPATTLDLLGLGALGVVALGASFWFVTRRRTRAAH
jgi:hypothetical protein